MKFKRHLCKKLDSGWSKEWGELISAASGGFLFGVPLLYTMEVWFIGSETQPPILLGILAITFIVVFLLDRVEGFRSQTNKTILDGIAETIETLAIGIVCATLILIVLEQIDLQIPLSEALGKIVFESVPCSLGVALSRSILTGDAGIDLKGNSVNSKSFVSQKKEQNKFIWLDTFADLSATLVGSVIIAFSIAPTDEVAMLASSASPPRLLIFIAASLIITYGIVFAAGFTNQTKRRQQQGIFQKPQSETLIYYLISLLASGLMLWFFQRLALDDPWMMWLRYSIILGLPSSIGGAAGRLAV
jgi:putative integral membrane protein (TIGR02587 family)